MTTWSGSEYKVLSGWQRLRWQWQREKKGPCCFLYMPKQPQISHISVRPLKAT